MALSTTALAQTGSASVVGTWETFDDHSGKPRGFIRISNDHGQLTGVAIGTAVPGERDDAICSKCTGTLKNHLMKGLPVIQGNSILDPDTGHVYKLKLSLSADGNSLTVRGYIGTPLFGRSQHWQRVSNRNQ